MDTEEHHEQGITGATSLGNVSSLRLTDLHVVRTLPYPIARAWRRLAHSGNDAERVRYLVDALEVVLRTMVALTLPDYLRGDKVEAVESAMGSLTKPQRGHYLSLLRELLRALKRRRDPGVFMPEAVAWFWGEGPKETMGDGPRLLEEALERRNQFEHREASPAGPQEWREARDEIEKPLRTLMQTLHWLDGYRLLRVNKQTRIRGLGPKRDRYKAEVAFFVGFDAHNPALETVEWGVSLPEEPRQLVFVVNPPGTAFLEVSPFLMYSAGEIAGERSPGSKKAAKRSVVRSEETCLLLKAVEPDGKRLLLTDDALRATLLTGIPLDESMMPLDEWLAHREELYIFHENPHQVRLAFEQARAPTVEALPSRYELKEELGRGSMAAVYRAYDNSWGNEVALKVMAPELASDRQFLERFEREMTVTKGFNHPNVVRVHERGKLDDGRLYYTMDLLEGASLREMITAEGVPEERVRQWAHELLSALAIVHGSGTIHRDIKPGNCLLDDNGSVRLADFGVARTVDSTLTTTIDRNLGNQRYASPEQSRGRPSDAKSDVYSLAMMLHELLDGDLPVVPGEGIEGPFGALLRKMGHQDPAQRPTAAEALAEIERIEGKDEPVQVKPEAPVPSSAAIRDLQDAVARLAANPADTLALGWLQTYATKTRAPIPRPAPNAKPQTASLASSSRPQPAPRSGAKPTASSPQVARPAAPVATPTSEARPAARAQSGKSPALRQTTDLDVFESLANKEPSAVDRLKTELSSRPDDGVLLHKLLAAYQDAGDFDGMLRTIPRIANLEPDPLLKAHYLHTMGNLHRDREDVDRAVKLFNEALDLNPDNLESFERINTMLTGAKDWAQLELSFRKMIHRIAGKGRIDLEYNLWHNLGIIYRDRLKQVDSAVECFKMASQLKPEEVMERQILAEIYESASQYDLAIEQQQEILRRDPTQVAPYRSLYQLYYAKQAFDEAWCLCAALSFLRRADEDQLKFFEDYRPKGIPAARNRLDNELWVKHVFHREEDVYVGKVFEMLTGASLQAKIRQLQATRQLPVLDKRYKQEADSTPVTFAKIFFHVAKVAGITPPELYVRNDLPGGLIAAPAIPFASIAGQSVLSGFTPHELAFTVGKHLALYRGEHYVKNIFATATELTQLFFVGLRMVLPDAAVPPEFAQRVDLTARALTPLMQPAAQEGLRHVVRKFMESRNDMNINRWVHATELTACRAGFLMCGDLEISKKLLLMETQMPQDLSPEEKITELIVFSISNDYFALRKALGFSIA